MTATFIPFGDAGTLTSSDRSSSRGVRNRRRSVRRGQRAGSASGGNRRTVGHDGRSNDNELVASVDGGSDHYRRADDIHDGSSDHHDRGTRGAGQH